MSIWQVMIDFNVYTLFIGEKLFGSLTLLYQAYPEWLPLFAKPPRQSLVRQYGNCWYEVHYVQRLIVLEYKEIVEHFIWVVTTDWLIVQEYKERAEYFIRVDAT